MDIQRDETTSSKHMTIVHFAMLRETKGAVLYQEVNAEGVPLKGDTDGAVIGSLYLRKAALNKIGKGVPKAIRGHFDIA